MYICIGREGSREEGRGKGKEGKWGREGKVKVVQVVQL